MYEALYFEHLKFTIIMAPGDNHMEHSESKRASTSFESSAWLLNTDLAPSNFSKYFPRNASCGATLAYLPTWLQPWITSSL